MWAKEKRMQRVLALGLWAGLLGCGPKGQLDVYAHHHLSDEDVVALVPAEQDGLIEIDVAALSRWSPSLALWELVPGGLRKRVVAMSDDPLLDVSAVAVGLRGLGQAEPEAIVILRGKDAGRKLWQRVVSLPESRQVTYHGLPVAENADETVAKLTEQTTAWGKKDAVRQAIDTFFGMEKGVRDQKNLMTALRLAPGAKTGRPPLLVALVGTKGLRERAGETDGLRFLADAEAVGAALAVGDGLDVGVVAAYPQNQMAVLAADEVKRRASAWSKDVGPLGRFVWPLVVVAVPENEKRKTAEVHLAYRLAGNELRTLIRLLQAGRFLPLQKD